MLFINNININTTNDNDKIILGDYYEKVFLDYLHNRKYVDYKKHKDKYNPYDFYSFSNNNNIFIELKTRLKSILHLDYVYISCSKICRYRIIEQEYNNKKKCKFYIIYNFVDINIESNEYYYYELDNKKILNNNITEISNDPCFIISIKDLKPIYLLFPFTYMEYIYYFINKKKLLIYIFFILLSTIFFTSNK